MNGRLAVAALLGALILLGAAGPARAQGSTTAFELDALDARAFAMGGTLVALPQDETAMRWNPALMVFLPGRGVTAGYSTPAAGLGAGHGAVAAAMPLGGALPNLPPGAPVWHSAAGVLLMTTGLDLVGGSRWSETQLGAGYAIAALPFLGVGGSARLLSNSTGAAGAAVSGFALDVGLGVMATRSLQAGLVLRNILSTVKWKDLDLSESLPNVVVMGAALDLGRSKGEAGLVLSGSQSAYGYAGAEHALLDGALKLRAGARAYFGQEPRGAPTAGVGLVRGAFRVDLAGSFDAATALGTTTALSLGYRFP